MDFDKKLNEALEVISERMANSKVTTVIPEYCEICKHNKQVGEIHVGEDDEWGGVEPAYICKKNEDQEKWWEAGKLDRCPYFEPDPAKLSYR